MLAARYLGNRRISVEEVPDPIIGRPDECLVRVMTCGICGTDKRIVSEPMVREDIQGHEVAGQVVAIGEAVTGLSVGDRVVVYNLIGCGQCDYCQRGQITYCRNTHGSVNGGFGEMLVAPERNLLPLPDEISYERGCLLSDVLGTPHKAMRLAGLAAGDAVVVLGCGPIGLGAVQIGVARGARVMAVDMLDYRLEAAAGMGAAAVCNAGREDVAEAAYAWSGAGADLSLDCTGREGAALTALACLRPGGRAMCVGANRRMDLDPWKQIISRDVTLGGSWYLHHEDYYECVELCRPSGLDPLSMVTHTVPLEEIARGFDLFIDQRESCIKVIVSVCAR